MNISSANALVMLLFSECCKVQTCRVLVQRGLAREQRAALSTLDVVWCGVAVLGDQEERSGSGPAEIMELVCSPRAVLPAGVNSVNSSRL